MATGKEGKPAKKGTPDTLLEELKVTASQPNPPAEVPPRDTDKADSGISAESIKSEREEDAVIDKNIKERRAAEDAVAPEAAASEGEQFADSLINKFNVFVAAEHSTKNESPITPAVVEAVPSELEHLSPEERKTYEKIPAEKRESYLAHVAEVRADKEKKENASKNKKPVKPRTQKPKAQAPEKIKEMTKRMQEETAEELKQMATARAAALKPSGADPDAPTIKMSVEAPTIESADKPNPDEDEEYPAVWRYNRDRRGNGEAQTESSVSEPEFPSTEMWQWPKSERTPAEERSYLRKLIEGAAEKTKDKFEWWKSAEEGLVRRNAELDAQLEKVGGVEKGFRWLGEKYNKLGWKSKLAVGAGLGLGAVFTAGTGAVAIPLALIAGQRIAGLSTMYLKFEKNSYQEKWGKEKAMLKAGVYTVLMGLAMKEAIEYASGTELAHAAQAKVEHTIQGWLGTMLGHESIITATNEGVGAAAPTPVTPHPVATGEVPAAGVAAEVAPEVAHTTMPEMPSIEAKAGDGYERMLQHLWEQSKGLDPNKFPEGSDIRRLIEANPKSIGAEIHLLATDNEFFKANGENVRINIGDKMTVSADGNIWVGEDIIAPEGTLVTPAFHPETNAPSVKALPNVTPAEAAKGIVITETPVEPFKPAEPFIPTETPIVLSAEIPPVVPPEMPPPPVSEVQPLSSETIVSPDTTATTMNAPESINEPYVETPVVNAPEPVSEPHVETPPVHAAETIAAQPPTPVIEQGFISNQLGLKIPVAEPHIYSGASTDDLFVHGGSSIQMKEKMIEYLTEHPGKVITAASENGKYRLPWGLVNGELIPGEPLRTSGFFGWLSERMKPPEVDELRKLIK